MIHGMLIRNKQSVRIFAAFCNDASNNTSNEYWTRGEFCVCQTIVSPTSQPPTAACYVSATTFCPRPCCVQILNRLWKCLMVLFCFTFFQELVFHFITWRLFRVMQIKCSVNCIILQVQPLYITCPFLTVIFVSTLTLPPEISYNCQCL
jgi:hypothetical protein